MTLLIDDDRELTADIIARTCEGARVILLAIGERLEAIYFDYDLDDYQDNGYKIMCYALEELCIRPKNIGIVTANPVGRKNMEACLSSCGYKKTHPNYWSFE